MNRWLVAFGDSWTYGDELLAPELQTNGSHVTNPTNDSYRLSNVYVGQIAKHYNLFLENLAANGGTIQSMVWEFEHWLDRTKDYKNCFLMFGLTHQSRMSYWSNQSNTYYNSNSLDDVPGGLEQFVLMNKLHYVNSNCYELERLNRQTAIHLFHYTCQQLEIPHLIFDIFDPIKITLYSPTIPGGLNSWLISESKRLNKTFKGDDHPNIAGHTHIAQHLIEYIDNNQILKSLI